MLSDILSTVTGGIRAYGRAIVFSALLHALLLAVLFSTEFSPAVKSTPSPAIVSYLYQPPAVTKPLPVESAPEPVAEKPVPLAEQQPPVVNEASTPITAKGSANTTDNSSTRPAAAVNDDARAIENTENTTNSSLVQRALNQASFGQSSQQAAMANAASAAYQQLLQAQQQPKITVEKRYQQLSIDPAGQVFAQLNDGRQLIRVKGGCRMADPGKDGFDALMVANAVVPCGDEEDSSALLKQALEKHIKR